MLSLKILLQEYQTIIISSLITKQVVIMRLKRERGLKRVRISELLP